MQLQSICHFLICQNRLPNCTEYNCCSHAQSNNYYRAAKTNRLQYSTFYQGGATAYTYDREEGWENFLFVWTEQRWRNKNQWQDSNLQPSAWASIFGYRPHGKKYYAQKRRLALPLCIQLVSYSMHTWYPEPMFSVL